MRLSTTFFFLLTFSANAFATTIVALPEPELVRRADTIVVGSVIRTDTVIRRGGRVATRATIQVQRAMRGAKPGEVILLEVPGGKLPHGLVSRVFGSPELRGGEMIFGFLEKRGDVLRPLGLSYGLLRVRQDASGIFRVFRETDGLAMIAPDGKQVDPSSVVLRDLPLEDFVARVSGRLAQLGLTPPGTVQP